MKTILEYLQSSNKEFIAPCNGQKKCGKCKVKIANRIIIANSDDRLQLTKKELADGYRLACGHHYHQGDIIITPAAAGKIEDEIYLLNNDLKQIKTKGLGIIVDIGTTTVVMKWISLCNGNIIKGESFFNPQVKYGSDVIARINYDSNDDCQVLSDLIIKSIFSRIYPSDIIKLILVCGNTTMINLFLKEKVKSLGQAPFSVPIVDMVKKPVNYFTDTKCKATLITINHISAYIGSDIVMGIYATDMDIKNEYSLLLDLGTNGEIVIGNKNKLIAVSCPAGPAFEGINIECGGPSLDGAICNTSIINGNVSHETIGNKKANSICGSGLVSLIANLKRLSIIDNFGNFVNGQKRYYVTDDVYLSQKDIKSFMLAKAAIQAGKQVLQKELNQKLDTIYIAGGFGNYLKKEDLVALNIISAQEQVIVKYIKNSALSGTYKLILSRDFERVQNISNLVQVVYLENNLNFNDYWLDAMEFI